MLGNGIVGVLLCGAALAVALLAILAGKTRAAHAPEPAVAQLLQAARRRALLAVGGAVVTLTALFWIEFGGDTFAGLPFLLAPALAGTVGLLLYGAVPPRATEIAADEPRKAQLTPRMPLGSLPRRALIWLAALLAAQAALLVFTGVTASLDEAGRSRVIALESPEAASAASPYPGWYYGVPLLVGTAILVGAAYFALRRISGTPALPRLAWAESDAGWRAVSNRVVLAVAGGALLLQFSQIAGIAGITSRSAALGSDATSWLILAVVLLVVAIAAGIGCLVLIVLAAKWAFGLPGIVLAAGTAPGPAPAAAAPDRGAAAPEAAR